MKTAAIVFLIVFLMVPTTFARVAYVPIEKMPSRADFIVLGTVVDSTCRWDERGVMIFTDYTVHLEEAIKGNLSEGGEIVMSFAGGTVGDETIIVSDTPRFQVGGRYFFFALSNEKSSVPLVGHDQGAFRVLKDQARGKEFIVDYNGYLLEILEDGKIIRGPLVDLEVEDRLVLKTVPEAKKIEIPPPVVRDAAGNIIPQDQGVFAPPRRRARGTPLVKTDLIFFVMEKILED